MATSWFFNSSVKLNMFNVKLRGINDYHCAWKW